MIHIISRCRTCAGYGKTKYKDYYTQQTNYRTCNTCKGDGKLEQTNLEDFKL